MKNNLVLISCLFLAFASFAQTKENRIGITIGGGSQKYHGDLGNAFTIKNRVWRGGFNATIGIYSGRSFDFGITGSIGDLGYCQPHEMANTEVDEDERCSGCIGRVGLGNLSSRMYTAGVSAKYKLNNGYFLKENARFKPYFFVGLSINKMVDRMKMNCVNAGNYFAMNTGFGVKYYLTERLNVGYSINLGRFLSDKMDFLNKGGNDMYMQNSITIGFDLF